MASRVPTHKLAEGLAIDCDQIALHSAIIPSLLRLVRERRGLTLATAASQMGYHAGVLSAWETGARPIPLSALPDISRWARNRYQSRRPEGATDG